MKRRGRRKARSRRGLTWFTIVGTLDEVLEIIRGFYETLETKHKRANETGDTASPFYGWELKKENVDVYVTLGFEGLTIFLYPKFEQYDHMDTLCHQLGESMYLATVEDVGGKPSYTEFVKVVDYLLSPLRDEVGRVHDSDVKAYCSGGRGYIVVTEEEARYEPLWEEMRAMGLRTPEDWLERMGYFGPQSLPRL